MSNYFPNIIYSCNNYGFKTKSKNNLRVFLPGPIKMFLLFAVVVGRGVRAESSTCDASYSDNGDACAFYSFCCFNSTTAIQAIPTCFNGLAQSPINLDSSSATVPDDPGQLTFSGFDDELPKTPVLRLKDFTVQLDFSQPMQVRGKKVGRKGGKKKWRKNRRRKNDPLKRSRRDGASLPSISGGALGDNT